ncbi:uncharacterized protein V6R79_019609 [Siganus canaliculatus]
MTKSSSSLREDVVVSHAARGNTVQQESKSYLVPGYSSGSRTQWIRAVNQPDNEKGPYGPKQKHKTGLMELMRCICRTAAQGMWLFDTMYKVISMIY